MSAELVVEDVTVRYGDQPAVRGASLTATGGRTLALVGESGCGKSSLALAIARLLPPGTEAAGSVRVGDLDLMALSGDEAREARGRIVAYVPQDAMAALNPVHPVGRQIAEVLAFRSGASRSEARTGACELLASVGMNDPDRVARRYPHELSGGMRQRVMIALALAGRPQVLIADEPTTALDVTVQAGILALVRELQAEHETTLVWITHDIGVVAEIADDVAVMYGGRIVEHGPAADVFERPAHPYTRALVSGPRESRLAEPRARFSALPGSPPHGELPPGCPFHPRCEFARDDCRTRMPEWTHVRGEHWGACHLLEPRA